MSSAAGGMKASRTEFRPRISKRFIWRRVETALKKIVVWEGMGNWMRGRWVISCKQTIIDHMNLIDAFNTRLRAKLASKKLVVAVATP